MHEESAPAPAQASQGAGDGDAAADEGAAPAGEAGASTPAPAAAGDGDAAAGAPATPAAPTATPAEASAAADAAAVGAEQLQGAKEANEVAQTMNNLGGVLNKIFEQVQEDEQVFKAFKEKVLQDEVAKANVDLSWPAIKDLVRSEVAVGRRKIENEVANFKIDVLDVIQKGLDSLRADLRATITTGFTLPAESGKRLPVPSKQSLKSLAEAEHGAAAAATEEEKKNAPDFGGNVDDDVVGESSATPDSANADDEEDVYERKTAYAKKQIEKIDRDLEGEVSEHDLADIKRFVADKMNKMAEADKHEKHPMDDYGLSAMEALRDLRVELAGKMSPKDLHAEVYHALTQLTKEHLQNPSPATKKALEQMRTEIINAVRKSAPAPAAAPSQQTQQVEAEAIQHDSLSARLNALAARSEESLKQHARLEGDSVDFSAKSGQHSAPAADHSNDRIIVDALDAQSPEAHAQDLQQAENSSTSGIKVEADIKPMTL